MVRGGLIASVLKVPALIGRAVTGSKYNS